MLTNKNFHLFLMSYGRDQLVRYMSSGTPICPICQKEHNDSDDAFDTNSLCDNCNIQHGFVVHPWTILKLYDIFRKNPLAYYYRKKVLKELIEMEPELYSGNPRYAITTSFPEKRTRIPGPAPCL